MKQTVRPKLKEFTIIGIEGLKNLKQRILFLEEENETLKNQKEQDAYNRLLKIRELEKEIKALKKNRQERG